MKPGLCDLIGAADERDVPADGLEGQQPVLLKAEGDARIPGQEHLAADRPLKPGNQAQQRRFAPSGRAENRVPAGRGEGEAEVGKDPLFAESHADVPETNVTHGAPP